MPTDLLKAAERIVQARKILDQHFALSDEERALLADPLLTEVVIQWTIRCGPRLDVGLEFRDEATLRRQAHPPRKARLDLRPGTPWAVRGREGILLAGIVGQNGEFVAQEGRVFGQLPAQERVFLSESSACGKAYILAGKKSYPARRAFRVLIDGQWRTTDT